MDNSQFLISFRVWLVSRFRINFSITKNELPPVYSLKFNQEIRSSGNYIIKTNKKQLKRLNNEELQIN